MWITLKTVNQTFPFNYFWLALKFLCWWFYKKFSKIYIFSLEVFIDLDKFSPMWFGAYHPHLDTHIVLFLMFKIFWVIPNWEKITHLVMKLLHFLHFCRFFLFLFQAILIAFTSEFIPKLVYKYEHDWNMSGYVNFTLATSPNEGWYNLE